MKTLLRVILVILGILVVIVLGAYADGAMMPLEHTVSVSGVVAASPEKVFARIIDIAAGSTWRPEVKNVTVLPKDNSRDAWIEDLGSGQTMKFLAITTVPPDASGHAIRVVKLDDPGAQYGGVWTYDLSPGPTPGTTNLTITEAGYINPPIYRFMMAHVFGTTKNLQEYMNHIQAATKS